MVNVKHEVAGPTGYRIRMELYRSVPQDTAADEVTDADVVAWVAECISDVTWLEDIKKFNKVSRHHNE